MTAGRARGTPRTAGSYPPAMSTVEALATADAAEAGGRTKSSSPRPIPVIGVVTPHEDMQVPSGSSAGAGKDNWVESRTRASLRDGEERSSSRGGRAAGDGGWMSSSNLSGDSSCVVLLERLAALWIVATKGRSHSR